ncbi:MAG: hypothetical protein C4536_06625 [Actinobacteria bacterium]|jgi:uncharacterized DUF497 family protein|nr:MAG: hypothetical protein C4536_06625 [Actinomycetota bacterium]
MTSEIDIEAFDWSDKIINHIWEHEVDPWEVEEVVFDDPDVEIRHGDDEEHGPRWMAQGHTAKGRKLRIFMNPCQNREGIWYVITAWEEGR